MKYDVLVVDDEESLLQGIVRGLSAASSLNPVGAGSLAEAVAVLDREPPDLLLTDMRLAGESGLDLISEVVQRGLQIPVVVMTAYRAAFADELARHQGLTVLEKPVPLASLRRVVEERLELARDAREEDPFDLCDYLQLASLGRTSSRFDVALENGVRGCLEVIEGEIWNVRAEGTEGREALALLLGSRCRKLAFDRLEERPRKRQLEASTESLLLEIATAVDEAKRHHESEGSPVAETVQPPQAREDPAAAAWCRAVVEEAAGGHCCRLLEIDTAAGVARWPPEIGAGEETQRTRGVLTLFRASAAGGSDAGHGSAVEEVSVAYPSGRGFFKRVSVHRVLALATAGDVRPGLAWLALRKAGAGLAASPAPEPTAPDDLLGAPLPRALDPALDRAAARVALRIAGTLCCAVVQLPCLMVRGASDPDAPDLASDLLARSADLFGPAGGGAGAGEPEAVDEVLLSTANRHYALARLPGGDWIAALVAESAARLPAIRLGLRDALPELAAALG